MAIENWSDEELDASVRTYLEMLKKEQQGEFFQKSDYRNRLLQGILQNRTPGSFEYRMQNISHVLNSLGQSYIKGYKPAANVGTNTFESIVKSLERNSYLDRNDFQPTTDPDVLQKRAKKLKPTIDLKNKPAGQTDPAKTQITSITYFRDPAVRAWVLKSAKGICEACGSDAPFRLMDDEPFLEVYHMIPLSQNRADTIENTVAVCPNCHRKCHLAKDRDSFNSMLYRKISRLKK